MENVVIDIFKNDNFLKAIPGLVAIIGLLISGYKQFFKVRTITEIDKLFLDKETKERLKFGKYIFNVIFLFFIYIITTIYFNFFWYEYLTSDQTLLLTVLQNSIKVFGVSFIIVSLLFSIHNRLKKSIWAMFIFTLSIFISLISSYFIFGYILSVLFFKNDNLYSLYAAILLLLALCFFYAHIASKMQKENHVPYSFRIISEVELKEIKNLIHGYTIDEKRTICFINDILNKETFYVCDFSSKVYIEYSKFIPRKKEKELSRSRTKKSKTNR
ncbi:hypothetical protein [Bacillus sp. BC08]